ncbi:hypothetical protein ACFV8T_30410 [Streptomyces sp. NPDC059832]|uniref:hypothetical protein n=1 Tax=Streptomyces sp. NPDC059832 TaxID=3346966 RepID=UPI0036504596
MGQEFAGPFIGWLLLAAGTGLALGLICASYAVAALALLLPVGPFQADRPAPDTVPVSHDTRAAITVPHTRLQVLVPEPAGLAQQAADATYALRKAIDRTELDARRHAAKEASVKPQSTVLEDDLRSQDPSRVRSSVHS